MARCKTKKAAADPSKPLKNARWEAFSNDVFAGMNQSEAYRKHYDTERYKPETVHQAAARLASKVRARVEWLQSQVATEKIVSKQEMAEAYSEWWRKYSLADFLFIGQDGRRYVEVTKEVLACPILKKVKTREVLSEQGDSVLSIAFTDLEVESRLAIGDRIERLMGYSAPIKSEHEVTVLDYRRRG